MIWDYKFKAFSVAHMLLTIAISDMYNDYRSTSAC